MSGPNHRRLERKGKSNERKGVTLYSLNQVITKEKMEMKNGNARNAMIRFGGERGKGKRKQ